MNDLAMCVPMSTCHVGRGHKCDRGGYFQIFPKKHAKKESKVHLIFLNTKIIKLNINRVFKIDYENIIKIF